MNVDHLSTIIFDVNGQIGLTFGQSKEDLENRKENNMIDCL